MALCCLVSGHTGRVGLRKVTLELPDKEARRRILEVHAKDVPLDDSVDLDVVAARTVGFSGADIENLVNEAALLAGRDAKRQVDMTAFDRARDKLILGEERDSKLTDDEREIVAYHEAGHALMTWLLPHADPLDKVTIIPRGRALGATEQRPEEERHNHRRKYLLDRIGVMLGGRVAERVVFDELSSGAEADIQQATQLARKMVCRWGMSERIGPVAFRRGEEHVFLGKEMAQQQDFSEHTARIIDEEISRLLRERENDVLERMRSNRARLDALAKRLLENETVEASEVTRLFETGAAA